VAGFDTSGFDDRSDSMSETNMDNRIFDFDGDESHASCSPGSPGAGGGLGGQHALPLGGGSSSSSCGGNKRFRTQMSNVQIKLMKSIFHLYKTPTMAECSSLGSEIGLQKRVVQVWFQNARAKEKKAKLQWQQATGQEIDNPPPPESCSFCGHTFSQRYAIQDHLFSRAHLDNVRRCIEEGRFDPEPPCTSSTAPPRRAASPSAPSPPRSPMAPQQPPNTSSQQQLQMLQLAAQGLRMPTTPSAASPGASDLSMKSSPGGGDVDNSLIMQRLYGLGHGPAANPFLHPAMFSATGKSVFLHIHAAFSLSLFVFW
jgi:AT-binding transcription factor 1